MELEVVKFIKQTLKKEKYGIPDWRYILSDAPYYINIIEQLIPPDGRFIYYLLKYNQIYSDFANPIVKECRGLIIRIDTYTNEVVPVCIPFFKFFNYGEPNADTLGEDIVFMEKLDGSLIKLWYDLGKWHWSTNGTIDAQYAPLGDNTSDKYKNFFDVIKKAKQYEIITNLLDNDNFFDRNYTYMFELTSNLTRIVVPYEKTTLTLLGVRNNKTYEYTPSAYMDLGDIAIPKPKVYNSIYNLVSINSAVKSLEGRKFNFEGYVAMDKDGHMVKIKNLAWLAASALRVGGGVTPERILKMKINGDDEEFLSYYPQDKVKFDEVDEKISSFCQMIKEIITKELTDNNPDLYNKYNGNPLEIQIAKDWRNGKIIKDWLFNKGADKVATLIGYNADTKEEE